MPTVVPIKPKYNGIKFRSHLEAKWAVFFDTVGIEYCYEPQGYRTVVGDCYLPDFYLPQFDAYVEVKGDEQRYHDDLLKMKRIIAGRGTPIRKLLVLGDVPYTEESNGVYWYPVLYYHPLKLCVLCEWRPIIWVDEEEHAKICFSWNPPLNLPDEFKTCALWEGSDSPIKSQRLKPAPDEEFEPEACSNEYKVLRERFRHVRLIKAYDKARNYDFKSKKAPQ